MKKNLTNLYLFVLFLLSTFSAEAIPLDDFYAASELSVVADQKQEQVLISEADPKSSLNDFKTGRKVKVISTSANGSIKAVIPKYSVGTNSTQVARNPFDTNGDGLVTPIDALVVINYLNGRTRQTANEAAPTNVDINKDGIITPLDALIIINCLNQSTRRGEASCRAPAPKVSDKPSLIVVTDPQGRGKVEVMYDGSSSAGISTLGTNGLNLDVKKTIGNELTIPYKYTSTTNANTTNLLKLTLSSEGANMESECKGNITEPTQRSGVYSSEGEMKINLSDCVGSADLTKVTGIKLTVDAENQGGMDLRIFGISGDRFNIGSPEDLSNGSVPSTPLPSVSPSIAPSISPSTSPSVPASPTSRCSNGQVEDACGVCGGSGPDACGNCGMGPFPPDRTPNICGTCGQPELNECGSCVNDPDKETDLGCGCGKPGPSGCDRVCGSTKVADSCGVCEGPGPDICGNCGMGPFPPNKEPNQCGTCGNPNLNECGFCPDDPTKKTNVGCGCGQPAPSGCDMQCGSTKVNVGCGCGQPAPTGCDMQCGSTKVVDACGVCGGDGSSCQCLFVAAWSDDSGYFGIDRYSHHQRDIFARFDVTRSEALPSCISQKISPKCMCGEGTINTIGSKNGRCSSQSVGIIQDASVKIWGACYFGHTTSGPDAQQNNLAEILGVPNPLRNLFSVPPLPGMANSDAQYWHFDKNCNFVSNPGNRKVCGYAGVSWSPISLILDEKIGLNEEMPVVEFNLAGKDEEGYVLWKASSSAPLLVYDPDNTNKVANAKQLFGSFAFGGKTKKLSDYKKDGYRAPWKNGYEALALLDKNNDKKINGSELKTLKLWYDNNRDGKSDEGEVKPLSDSQITGILYANPTAVADSKDIELKVGYERNVKGRTVQGKSVDWFSETFTSKAEAKAALIGIFNQGDKAEATTESKEVSVVNSVLKSDADFKGISIDSRDNMSGYWVYTILEKGADKNPGIFVLSERTDGGLFGYSVAEAVLADNPENIRSAMFAVPGYGKIIRGENNKSEVSLIFRDPKAGGVAESTATLSEDGMVMTGTTTQAFAVKVKGDIKSAKVTYDWVATKTFTEPQG